MSKNSNRWLAYLDASLWLVYLGLVATISFLNRPYLSEEWLSYSFFFYAFIAIYSVSLMLGGRCNSTALHNARYAIALCFLSLFWLWVQSILPITNYLSEYVFDGKQELTWFDPASTWSVTPDKTRWLFFRNFLVILLFVVSLCLLDTRRRVKQVLILFLLVGAVHALVGVLAKYSNLQLVDLSQIDGHYDAARAWFVNRNHFASFVSLCIFGALAYQIKVFLSLGKTRPMSYLTAQLISVRVLFIMSLVLSMLAIILSQSRGAFLALLLSILFLITLLSRDSRFSMQRRYFVVPIVVITLAMLGYFGDALIGRFTQDSLVGGERFEQWNLTWRAISHQALIGYGGGSYATVFQVFREYADLRQVVFDQAHNEYLHIWLEQGLIGLLFWLGFLVLALANALRSARTHSSRLVVAVSYAGIVVVVAALLQAGVAYNLQITNIRSYFFAIIAVLFAAPSIVHRRT